MKGSSTSCARSPCSVAAPELKKGLAADWEKGSALAEAVAGAVGRKKAESPESWRGGVWDRNRVLES